MRCRGGTVSKLPDYLILDLGNVQNIAEVIENGRTVRKVCLFKWPYNIITGIA